MTQPSRLPTWNVRVADVPPNGVHVRRSGLSAECLKAFAERIGVDAVLSLEVDAHVKPYRGDGLAVEGRVAATVAQTCVVTLEPVENRLDEEIEITFRPEHKLKPELVHDDEDGLSIDASAAADDPLIGNAIDVADIAAEFLALGVDPYPRKPGVAFEAPAAGDEEAPFAALARLKRKD